MFFGELLLHVCSKNHPQSHPRFNIVSWFVVVRSLSFIYNMSTLIPVNQSLDEIGLPFNWLTNVLLKIIGSPTTTYVIMDFILDWVGIWTFSWSSIRTSKACQSLLSNFTSSCKTLSTASLPSIWQHPCTCLNCLLQHYNCPDLGQLAN